MAIMVNWPNWINPALKKTEYSCPVCLRKSQTQAKREQSGGRPTQLIEAVTEAAKATLIWLVFGKTPMLHFWLMNRLAKVPVICKECEKRITRV